MHTKEWKIKELPDETKVSPLAEALTVTPTLAQLLVARGIYSFSQARRFFRPNLADLHNPFLMGGMEEATGRVIRAITSNEKILVYGDYDVDGTCSTALMYMFLRSLDANVQYYIPNRISEGYGLSKQGIDYARETGTTLMISVDCGITALDETRYSNECGIDLIICDHHKPKDTLPEAFAVLDPLKPGCNYPFKYLSGAGVAFKLAQGVSDRIGKHDLPLQYLDLVALAGAADIVPLVDENRTLVSVGMLAINENPRPGIRALINSARLVPGQLTSGQMVFTIAPRINAVGRLGDAGIAVELLITNDAQQAAAMAQKLEDENRERRKIDEVTLNQAMQQITDDFPVEDDCAIILHGDNWHPGVIGIVASRLVEKYYKPTIMLTTIDGVAKGSARSIQQFNIYDALKDCEDLLLHFGGHEAAAGLAVELHNLDEFRRRFNERVKEQMGEKGFIPVITIDSKVHFSEISPKFIRVLNQFAPFGPGNHRPVFLAEEVMLAGAPRIVGNNHLVFSMRQRDCDRVFDAIGFDMGQLYDKLNNGYPCFDIVFTIDQMVRDGKTYPQFRLNDLKPREF